MRKPLLAGNWKMNKTKEEALSFIHELTKEAFDTTTEVLICPPALYIDALVEATKDSSVMIGAQNVYHEHFGAYTGEVNTTMLQSIGATHVIIGHSERRDLFFEQDNDVQMKTKAAISHGLTPILCCGESLLEFKLGVTKEIIYKQIRFALHTLTAEEAKHIVIAYEPIWAIGTGEVATPEIANRVCQFIRETIASMFSKEVADSVLVLYGGSVNAENIQSLVAEEHIDGALIGGASLDIHSFIQLIQNSKKVTLS